MDVQEEKAAGAQREAHKIQVLVADENPIVREGLRSMLHNSPAEVVGEATSGAKVAEQVKALTPDVVLLGLSEPGLSIASVEVVKGARPEAAVVVLSEDSGDLLVLLHNSINCLSRTVDREDLLAAVVAAADGRSLADQSTVVKAIAAATRAERQKGASPGERAHRLTPRERQVLGLITQGCTNRQIVERLSLSVGTVKVHVCNILTKLDVADRVQAAVWATQHGLQVRHDGSDGRDP